MGLGVRRIIGNKDKHGVSQKKYGKLNQRLGSGVTSDVHLYIKRNKDGRRGGGDTSYAIKLFRNDKTDNHKDITKLIYNEFELLTDLQNHRNIVDTFELFKINNDSFRFGIVFEYLPNKLSINLLKGLNRDTRKSLVHQLIEVISTLHTRRIVHLDLKLDNLFLTNDSILKLIDFGSSQRYDSNNKESIGLKGTLNYCPPEIFTSMRYDGYLADSWSLGILMVLILTLKPPSWESAKVHDDVHFKEYQQGYENDGMECLKDFIDVSNLDPLDLCCIYKLLCPDPNNRLTVLDLSDIYNS